MTPPSRSASTLWACSAIKGMALALALAGGCGPALGPLLRDRHYEDAICAASLDGTGVSAQRVSKSLAQDLQSAVHLYPISAEELRRGVGDRLRQDVARLQQEFLFVRLLYSANRVPAGPFGLAISVQAGHSPLRIIDFSRYEPLLALTHERVPTPRTGVTNSSGAALLANILTSPFLLIANVFSVPLTGRAVYFRGRQRQVTLPLDDSDWQAGAPDAYFLRQALRPSECLDAMTRPCQAFFAIERPGATAEAESAQPVQLQFALSFGPLPIYRNQPEGPACSLDLTYTVELAPGLPLAERLSGRFGNQQRLFSELDAELSATAEVLRPER